MAAIQDNFKIVENGKPKWVSEVHHPNQSFPLLDPCYGLQFSHV